MSLRVYGVVMHDGQGPPKIPAGVKLVSVRELAAVAEEGDYSARDVDAPDIERHLDVVRTLFEQDAVLPTPVGTVFRSPEVLLRWMELHYVALSDALAWVEDRVGARVHVSRAKSPPRASEREPGADFAPVAAEVTRSLRRRAVASVPLRPASESGVAGGGRGGTTRTGEHRAEDHVVAALDTATVLSAAFLVEGELWHEFADAVADEQERHPLLHLELSGPWPPYDFVRLQFGA